MAADFCGAARLRPPDGAQAEELVALAGETLLRYGFEPAISLTMITERSLACVISITYDRHVPGEDEKASACYRELLRRLTDGGFPCYRMTSQSSGGMKASAGLRPRAAVAQTEPGSEPDTGAGTVSASGVTYTPCVRLGTVL